MTTTETLTRQRKVEIDTRIADIAYALHRLSYEIKSESEHLHRAAGDERIPGPKDQYGRFERVWQKSLAECIATITTLPADHYGHSTLTKYNALRADEADLISEQKALNAIWLEHGWSRFYYVQNNNGHIHKDTYCSTCYDTTQFAWLTDLSDQTEAEAVESFGKVLCSVCYPSAPTDWTDGEPIEKIKAREDAAVRKAERLAKKLEKALLPDGSETVLTTEIYGRYWDGNTRTYVEGVHTVSDRITTLAQAKTWLRDITDSRAEHRGKVSGYIAETRAWSPDNEAWVVEKIAEKTGSTPEAVAAEAAEKAEKKAKKNGLWAGDF